MSESVNINQQSSVNPSEVRALKKEAQRLLKKVQRLLDARDDELHDRFGIGEGLEWTDNFRGELSNVVTYLGNACMYLRYSAEKARNYYAKYPKKNRR